MLLLPSTEAAADASASAGTGWFASRADDDDDLESWYNSQPKGTEDITWTSGENKTDGVTHVKNTFGPELKFDPVLSAPLPPYYVVQEFDGFDDTDGPGPSGSTTHTKSGYSFSMQYRLPGIYWGFNDVWLIRMKVEASGTLGTGGSPSWSAQAEADDPWPISASDLEPDALDGFDLLYVVYLEDTTYSSLGSARLFTSYETPTETRVILDITLDVTGASVAGDSSALFYSFDSFEDLGVVIPSTDVTLAEIEADLHADVFGDNSLDSGLYLAIVLPDLTLPASTFGDGSFAKIHVGMAVEDAAVAPVPALSPIAKLALVVGLGFVGIAAQRRRGAL